MREYNDWVKTTKNWLKNYRAFEAMRDNLKVSIEDNERLLESDVSAPIARYGDMPGGGTPELNFIESAAYRHSVIESRMDIMRENLKSVERTLQKINRALEALSSRDRNIVTAHYLNFKTWQEIGNEQYITEKWARDLGNDIVKKMARMIFGNEAIPEQTSLFRFFNG